MLFHPSQLALSRGSFLPLLPHCSCCLGLLASGAACTWERIGLFPSTDPCSLLLTAIGITPSSFSKPLITWWPCGPVFHSPLLNGAVCTGQCILIVSPGRTGNGTKVFSFSGQLSSPDSSECFHPESLTRRGGDWQRRVSTDKHF